MKTRSRGKKPATRRGSPTMRKRKSKASAPPSPARLMQFVWGFAPTLILESAVKHRVFDHLDPAPKTVEQLANDTQCSVRGLTALLDALVGFEFLKRKGNRYALTPESSAFLVSSKADYHGGFFQQVTGQVMPSWMPLTEIVR